MAFTYTLINSTTLTTGTANVTFSSLPATYTDLNIRCSVRNTTIGNNVSDFSLKINGLTGNIYSRTQINGDGATDTSTRTANTSINNFEDMMNGAASTSASFSNVDIYIPNYAGSNNKPHSVVGAMETNASTAYIGIQANLINDTSPISSIVFTSGSGNFAVGSSFYLYGISNT